MDIHRYEVDKHSWAEEIVGVRAGKQYVDRLSRQTRQVWIRGRCVQDVTTEPTLAGALDTVRRLYDLQCSDEHRDLMTYECPETGETFGASYLRPTSQADIVKRRNTMRVWAEASFGMLGRSPDFLNTTLMTFADCANYFGEGRPEFAENIKRYYEYCRREDLFLTHAIVPPQTDRSKSSAAQADEFMHLGLVEQRSDGIVVRGAKMLATHGPLADELMVYPSYVAPGDGRYALGFAIPCDAPGLKFICREPFLSGGESEWDHPLSTRFEEPDAIVIFDDVFVPADRVFLLGNPDHANRLAPGTNQRHFTGHQTAVRGLAKLRFTTGLAIALTRSVKSDIFLHVQEQLGELLGYLSLVEGATLLAEQKADYTETGTLRPAYEPLQAIRYHLPKMYERAVAVTQVLGAGGLLLNPTEADFASPIREDIDRYYQGAGIDAKTRIQISKLAWDATGTQFAQRMVQYERYYAGDPIRLAAGSYLSYNADELLAYVTSAFSKELS